jgi:hypothetical protein
MLKLRRGIVVGADPLEVEIDGERRRAWADPALVGPTEIGDEVVVNVEALDLALGSGGFDVVHVNLTRGLAGGSPPEGVHVMKLNYTSLQHAVDPVEAPADSSPLPERPIPVLVLPLHGHLAPAAWAAAGGSEAPQAGRRPRVGFVQGAGAALSGSLSRDVASLREQGLLCEHLTAGPCFGGEEEAISVLGGLHAAAGGRGWDAAIVGPGPGILGSATHYGHGAIASLEAAHAALALGLPTLVSPRLSAGDPRSRHLGLSHHTRSILSLALAPVGVPVPTELESLWPEAAEWPTGGQAEIFGNRHTLMAEEADLAGYAETGLPSRTMGRELEQDRLFFAAPLAAGAALARLLAEG